MKIFYFFDFNGDTSQVAWEILAKVNKRQDPLHKGHTINSKPVGFFKGCWFNNYFYKKYLYPPPLDERQVFWILGYFTDVKFLPFRHFTITKNISQLNVRHAFQASYPSIIVPSFPKLDMHSSIQKTWHSCHLMPQNRSLVNEVW